MTTTSKATPGDLVMDAPRPTIRKRKLFASDVMKHHRQKRPKKDVNLGNPIDVDKIITKSPIKSPSPWLPSIGLSQIERDILISQSRWLNDRIVNAAQLLIKKANPGISGLQDVTCGLVLSFEVQSGEFIQILHNGLDHWILISTIGLIHPEVAVFDSLYPTVNANVKMQVASILSTKESSIVLHYRNVQMQSGSSDCGVFAIAFATALAFGNDPSEFIFDQSQMRKHLMKCLQNNSITMFPVK